MPHSPSMIAVGHPSNPDVVWVRADLVQAVRRVHHEPNGVQLAVDLTTGESYSESVVYYDDADPVGEFLRCWSAVFEGE